MMRASEYEIEEAKLFCLEALADNDETFADIIIRHYASTVEMPFEQFKKTLFEVN